MNMASNDVTVVVCGGGNGAHTLAGLASSRPGAKARVLTMYADEAQQWSNAMKDGLRVHYLDQGSETKKIDVAPFLVTKDPATAVGDGADIIVLVVPAFAHTLYLEAIKPFIKPGMVVMGLPGHGGFDFAVRSVLGPLAKEITIINAESLPWACRIREFGKDVDILGTKTQLEGGASLGSVPPKADITQMIQQVWGDLPKFILTGCLLGITLTRSPYMHPSFMFAKWSDWDGKPLDEPPLFYHGADDRAIGLIEGVAEEVAHMAQKIKERYPKTDLGDICNMYDIMLKFYEKDISDKSSLKSAIRTNKSYTGLKHPMDKTDDGKYVPKFDYRYLTEDIPCGLVVLRGIAEITGVATPIIDKVLLWGQQKIGKEYLKDGSLKGKDVASSRAPQAFGYTTLEDLLQ